MAEMGVENCVELDWWKSCTLMSRTNQPIKITFTPTKHWTARGFFDRNTCLWGSYVVNTPNFNYFFTGDTAYCEIFKLIGEKFGPFDLAAIPIGAYEPRWFMKDVHCNPEEAVQIHLDLGAKQSVAIHHGTFPMADEDFLAPAFDLGIARHKLAVCNSQFFTAAHGEMIKMGEASKFDIVDLHASLFTQYQNATTGPSTSTSSDVHASAAGTNKSSVANVSSSVSESIRNSVHLSSSNSQIVN